MDNEKRFLPNNRWFGGLIILFTVYLAYGIFAPLFEVYLPQSAASTGMGAIQQFQVNGIISTVENNWWYGILLLTLGTLLYLLIAGIPGQQEEKWQDWGY